MFGEAFSYSSVENIIKTCFIKHGIRIVINSQLLKLTQVERAMLTNRSQLGIVCFVLYIMWCMLLNLCAVQSSKLYFLTEFTNIAQI